jgi:Family of unknown function (DUF1028)/Invasin, domain 3
VRRRLLVAGAALLLTTGQALATWSIVVVNLVTREVCSATASCVEGTDLDLTVPIVVVGKGAGAAQAFVQSNAQNRKLMFKGFKQGLEPAVILDQIDQGDTLEFRQFGIVGMVGAPVTFSGDTLSNGNVFQWVGGVAGQSGDLLYAIQGNALAGAAVVGEAEWALLNTPGDLSTKVMAAMVAAGAMGGDGRCSCDPGDADSCGTPPPNFTKSAHQALIVLARPGDTNGKCNGDLGCVNGDYYLAMEETGFAADSDPVIRLQQSYLTWRAGLSGMADHYHSRVQVDRDVLPADGQSMATVRVSLVDIDGLPLLSGGDSLRFERLRGGALRATPGKVIDRGDGTYEFPLTATGTTGREVWAVVVERPGQRPVQLATPVVIETGPPADLFLESFEWSAATDAAAHFLLDRGPGEAGRPYMLLGTSAGTVPGFDLAGGLHVPLNRSRLLERALLGPAPELVGFIGALDGEGRAQASLELSPAAAAVFVGERLDFCALLTGPGQAEVTTLVGFQVVP